MYVDSNVAQGNSKMSITSEVKHISRKRNSTVFNNYKTSLTFLCTLFLYTIEIKSSLNISTENDRLHDEKKTENEHINEIISG